MEDVNYNDFSYLDVEPTPQAVAWQNMLRKRQEFMTLHAKYRFVKNKLPLTAEQKTKHLRRLRRNLWLCYFLYFVLKRHYMEMRQAEMQESDPDLKRLEIQHGAPFAQELIDKGYLQILRAA